MWRKVLIIILTILFAFGILLISFFRAAAVRYEFGSRKNLDPQVTSGQLLYIDYKLAFPGRVLPDSALWPLKALRDRVWLFITTSSTKRAELNLLFADKRLGSAKILAENGKPDIAISTLTKAEKYLESASLIEAENRAKGLKTEEFLEILAYASLKHYEVLNQIAEIVPEEAEPIVIQSEDYSKKVYEEARNALREKGIAPPENPFDW